MATAAAVSATAYDAGKQPEKRPRSIFELPENFFDSCRLLPPGKHRVSAAQLSSSADDETLISDQLNNNNNSSSMSRWSCNTCKAEFDSLVDQRSHFKSDFHRFNVKLSLAGKDTLKEDDLDELTSDSFPKDFDVSSISGSEDELDRPPRALTSINETLARSIKQKIFIRLQSGEKVSIWKSLILSDSKTISCENDQFVVVDNNGIVPCLREVDVIEKLKGLTHERRDNTHLRIVLLSSGGHFAGCVFDGNNVVAHKTFHRYVVRAKAGKMQSSKDGSGKSIHSAGASIRRYNELALKKNIQELLASWKPYFDASTCVFIYSPSSNRQLFYNGETPLFSNRHCDVKGIPFSVRRPTLKEARRIYGQLSLVNFEVDEEELPDLRQLELNPSNINNTNFVNESEKGEAEITYRPEVCETTEISVEQSSSGEKDMEVISTTTPLHEAARSGDVEKVLEFLEQGLDPTVKDERGRTPYMTATEKKVRNTFRRFMASNLEKWDWHAANVPSPLTKEMEESQNAKQAEKDAKRKAKAKELKKLRKEREKKEKAQAMAAELQKAAAVSQGKSIASSSNVSSLQSSSAPRLSKEEELKRKMAEDREKRAAAAERRMAMAAPATGSSANPVAPSTSQPRSGVSSDIVCSCSNASLAGSLGYLTPEDLAAIGLDAKNRPLENPTAVDYKLHKPTLKELVKMQAIPERPMGKKRPSYKPRGDRKPEQAGSMSSPRPDLEGAALESAPEVPHPSPPRETRVSQPPPPKPHATKVELIESESPHSEDARPFKKQKKGSSSKVQVAEQGQVSVAIPGAGASSVGGTMERQAGLVKEIPPIAGGLAINAVELVMQARRSIDALSKFAERTAGDLDRLRREGSDPLAQKELKEVAGRLKKAIRAREREVESLKAEVQTLLAKLKEKESQLEDLSKEKEGLTLQYTELFQARDAAVVRAEAAEAEKAAGAAKAARLELEMDQLKAAHQNELVKVRANSFYDGVDHGALETKELIDQVSPDFDFDRLAQLEDARDRRREEERHAAAEAGAGAAGC